MTTARVIAVTGASGLVGRALCARLEADGRTVRPLVRRAPVGREIRWDPARAELNPEDLLGVDAVVHLAGESIVGRWTTEKKRRIHDSRVEGTRLLAEAMAACAVPPALLLSASAVGYYGHREQPVDEAAPQGAGFLADVCAAWEQAAEPARAGGVRVTHPRIGIVLAREGGALQSMLPTFRLGVGGPMGSGAQGLPWIHIADLVSALTFLLDRPLDGPVNMVSPELTAQRAFASALGEALGRPACLPAPAFAIRLAMGEMGQATLLEGAPVQPTQLRDAGYVWTHPTLVGALRDLLTS